MSADRWGECPQCKKRATVVCTQRQQKAIEAYGKVPPEEYEKLRQDAIKPVEDNDTFREDYEIGLHKDGTFRVNYKGRCNACGSGFEFKHEEKVKVV